MANSSGRLTKQIFRALGRRHTIGSEELFAFGKISPNIQQIAECNERVNVIRRLGNQG